MLSALTNILLDSLKPNIWTQLKVNILKLRNFMISNWWMHVMFIEHHQNMLSKLLDGDMIKVRSFNRWCFLSADVFYDKSPPGLKPWAFCVLSEFLQLQFGTEESCSKLKQVLITHHKVYLYLFIHLSTLDFLSKKWFSWITTCSVVLFYNWNKKKTQTNPQKGEKTT